MVIKHTKYQICIKITGLLDKTSIEEDSTKKSALLWINGAYTLGNKLIITLSSVIYIVQNYNRDMIRLVNKSFSFKRGHR